MTPRQFLRRLPTLPIRFYSYFISPWLPPSCRFTPTCSAYALQAIEMHGPVYGSYLATRRLCRCHPWGLGGHDPVPPPAPRQGTESHPGSD